MQTSSSAAMSWLPAGGVGNFATTSSSPRLAVITGPVGVGVAADSRLVVSRSASACTLPSSATSAMTSKPQNHSNAGAIVQLRSPADTVVEGKRTIGGVKNVMP
jgi:hypothetical protein